MSIWDSESSCKESMFCPSERELRVNIPPLGY